MIGKLTGTIDSFSGNQLIIDVRGVGYVVACSARTLRQMGVGMTVSLLIETQIREDAFNLFGFLDTGERDWFRLLTTVQGVGAKVALAILGVLSPEQLTQAIAAQDKAAVAQADGVGPKLALRLVTELKDRVPSFGFTPQQSAIQGAQPATLHDDALSALLNLGYKRMEAFAAVAAAAQKLGSDARIDALIKTSLAELSRKDHAA